MNPTSTVPVAGRLQTHSSSRDRARLFYAGTACVMLLAVLVGFRHFFLEGRSHPGRDLAPQIRTLIIIHGVSMTGWVLVFLIQSLLIATRRHRIHMMIGRIAAVFAASILVSGLWLTLVSFRLVPPEFVIWALTMKQFMVLGFYTILMFAVFVGVGLWYRRRPEIHRPMMLLATLSTMAPAIARIDALNVLYQGTALERIFGPSLGMLVLGAVFFLVKWCITKSMDRWYLTGYGVLAFTQLSMIQFARTRAWDQIASFLLR